MKKPTDFAYTLSKFFSEYLTGLCNFSENTICSYRDTFKLFLKFCNNEVGIPAEKITFDNIDMSMIEQFLKWLKQERNVSTSTCNQRLAAIHAFFRYVQYEHPERTVLCQQVLFLKFAKAPKTELNYMSIEGVQALLAIPNTATANGRRELAILSLLYDSGARVQEIVDLRFGDVRLLNPAVVRLTGKGSKVRSVPLLRACLKSSNEDGNEGKRENLSRNIKFAFTIFPKSAEFVEPSEKTLYHPAAWQNDKLV